MPESPIRKLAPKAEEAVSRGVHVHHLNIGQPDILTPVWALQKMKDPVAKVIEYSPSAGNLSLRKE